MNPPVAPKLTAVHDAVRTIASALLKGSNVASLDTKALVNKMQAACYPSDTLARVVRAIGATETTLGPQMTEAALDVIEAYVDSLSKKGQLLPPQKCVDCNGAYATVGPKSGRNRLWCWSCFWLRRRDYNKYYGTHSHVDDARENVVCAALRNIYCCDRKGALIIRQSEEDVASAAMAQMPPTYMRRTLGNMRYVPKIYASGRSDPPAGGPPPPRYVPRIYASGRSDPPAGGPPPPPPPPPPPDFFDPPPQQSAGAKKKKKKGGITDSISKATAKAVSYLDEMKSGLTKPLRSVKDLPQQQQQTPVVVSRDDVMSEMKNAFAKIQKGETILKPPEERQLPPAPVAGPSRQQQQQPAVVSRDDVMHEMKNVFAKIQKGETILRTRPPADEDATPPPQPPPQQTLQQSLDSSLKIQIEKMRPAIAGNSSDEDNDTTWEDEDEEERKREQEYKDKYERNEEERRRIEEEDERQRKAKNEEYLRKLQEEKLQREEEEKRRSEEKRLEEERRRNEESKRRDEEEKRRLEEAKRLEDEKRRDEEERLEQQRLEESSVRSNDEDMSSDGEGSTAHDQSVDERIVVRTQLTQKEQQGQILAHADDGGPDVFVIEGATLPPQPPPPVTTTTTAAAAAAAAAVITTTPDTQQPVDAAAASEEDLQTMQRDTHMYKGILDTSQQITAREYVSHVPTSSSWSSALGSAPDPTSPNCSHMWPSIADTIHFNNRWLRQQRYGRYGGKSSPLRRIIYHEDDPPLYALSKLPEYFPPVATTAGDDGSPAHFMNDLQNGSWKQRSSSNPKEIWCPMCTEYAAVVFAFPCSHALGCAYCFSNFRRTVIKGYVPRCMRCGISYSYAYYEHRYALHVYANDVGVYNVTTVHASPPGGDASRWTVRTLFLAEEFSKHVCGNVTPMESKNEYGWLRALAFVHAMEFRGEVEFPFSNICSLPVIPYSLYDMTHAMKLPSVMCCTGSVTDPNTRVYVPILGGSETEPPMWIQIPLFKYVYLAGLVCAYRSKLRFMGVLQYDNENDDDAAAAAGDRKKADWSPWPPIDNPIAYILTAAAESRTAAAAVAGRDVESLVEAVLNTIAAYAEPSCRTENRCVVTAAAIVGVAMSGLYPGISSVEHVLRTTSGGRLHAGFAILATQALRETWCMAPLVAQTSSRSKVECNDPPQSRRVHYDSRRNCIVFNTKDLNLELLPNHSRSCARFAKRAMQIAVTQISSSRPSFTFMSSSRTLTRNRLPPYKSRCSAKKMRALATTLTLASDPETTTTTSVNSETTLADSFAAYIEGSDVGISGIPRIPLLLENAFKRAVQFTLGEVVDVKHMVEYAFGNDELRPVVDEGGDSMQCNAVSLADHLKTLMFINGWVRWSRKFAAPTYAAPKTRIVGEVKYPRLNVEDVRKRYAHYLTDFDDGHTPHRYADTVVLSDRDKLISVLTAFFGEDNRRLKDNPIGYMNIVLSSPTMYSRLMQEVLPQMGLQLVPVKQSSNSGVPPYKLRRLT